MFRLAVIIRRTAAGATGQQQRRRRQQQQQTLLRRRFYYSYCSMTTMMNNNNVSSSSNGDGDAVVTSSSAIVSASSNTAAATTPTTTPKTTSSRLVWKFVDDDDDPRHRRTTTTKQQHQHHHVHISLVENDNVDQKEEEQASEKQQQQQQKQNEDELNIANDDECNNNNNSSNNSLIPDSVLTYERHLRKVQHSQKAGRMLSPERDLRVIYQDNSIVVANKSSGVLTVPGIKNRNNSLANLVYDKYCCNDTTNATSGDDNDEDNDDGRSTNTNQMRMKLDQMIVHRLDMDTSGLIVFGLTLEATRALHKLFRDDRVTKEYEALVVGHLLSDNIAQTGTINLPLQRDHEHPPFMRVSTCESEQEAMNVVDQLQQNGFKKLVRKKPKPSCTQFEIMERGYYYYTPNKDGGEGGDDDGDDDGNNRSSPSPEERRRRLPYTRLKLKPITGRTHQLRVHCAAIGHPIIGDPTYGLYGEANMYGGLQNVPSEILILQQQQDDGGSSSNKKEDDNNDINQRHRQKPNGCSIEIQKQWLEAYPPNENPMCLHARYLAFQHPLLMKDTTTNNNNNNQKLKFDVPPPTYFFF